MLAREIQHRTHVNLVKRIAVMAFYVMVIVALINWMFAMELRIVLMHLMSIQSIANRLYVRRTFTFNARKQSNAFRKLGSVITILTVQTNRMKRKIVMIVRSFCAIIRCAYHIRRCVTVWIIVGESMFFSYYLFPLVIRIKILIFS